MTTLEIITSGGGVLAVIMTLIQLAPIKINPWSAIGRALGKVLNHEVLEKVDKLDRELETLKNEVSENVATDCRARILRFGDEVFHGERHSKDHFEHILRDIKRYELYCNEHPDFENNVTELTASRIADIYKECLENNNFI